MSCSHLEIKENDQSDRMKNRNVACNDVCGGYSRRVWSNVKKKKEGEREREEERGGMMRFEIKGCLIWLYGLIVLYGSGDLTYIHLNSKLKALLPSKFLMQMCPGVLGGSYEQLILKNTG